LTPQIYTNIQETVVLLYKYYYLFDSCVVSRYLLAKFGFNLLLLYDIKHSKWDVFVENFNRNLVKNTNKNDLSIQVS
jgi:hypothetical protein